MERKNTLDMKDQGVPFKVVMLGDVCVGKTCVVNRFIKESFGASAPTMAASFASKTIAVNPLLEEKPTLIKLQLWDTAGSEKFRSLSQLYYKKAAVVCLTYDVTSSHSFDALEHWVAELAENAENEVIKFIVGNKCDLSEQEEVSAKQASAYAKQIGASFFETSAKNNTGITELFTAIASKCATNMHLANDP